MATESERCLFGKSVDDHVKTGMAKVHAVMKLAMELRGLQNYSDYPGVNAALKAFRSSISNCMKDILRHEDVGVQLPANFGLADKMEMLRDANDCLIERIHSEIDEAAGIHREGTMDISQPVVTTVEARRVLPGREDSALNTSMILMASRNVQKPQLFFSEKIDNSSKTPFVPIIKDKPNSLKPLAVMLCLTQDGREFYSHPYQYELEHWTPDMQKLGTPVEPVVPPAVADTPLVMVDTEAALEGAVQELAQCSHIAVDVEHHAFRSYLGLTSLIQVSSRTKDYIIDPIKLRGRLTILNEVFTHPKITKVLHGADSDVVWLQRDCGVYLVNMFDTHIAAVLLEFPQRSLAALLNTFCNVQADKRYQRADWRIRPLPSSFIEYARQDTHYLLYIHDLLHNMLLERANGDTNLLQAVYDRSTALCLQRYEKPVVTEESYLPLYSRSRKFFNNRQLHALQKLYLWRDKTAREHDESVDFVLPRHMLLHIAEVLPKEVQGIMACCNPIPALVKTELLTLHSIIRAAREQPLRKTVPSRMEMSSVVAASGGSVLCLHDLSAIEDTSSLPCLLDGSNSKAYESLFGDMFEEKPIIVKMKAASDLLGSLIPRTSQKKRKTSSSGQFLSPFERYRLYVDSKEKLPVFEEAKASGNDSTLDDKDKQSLTVVIGTEDERVSRLRDHFLALAKTVPGPKREPPPKDEDDLRVERLLAEVRNNMMKTTPPPLAFNASTQSALDSQDDSSDSDTSDSNSSDSESEDDVNCSQEAVEKQRPGSVKSNHSGSSDSSSTSDSEDDGAKDLTTNQASVEAQRSNSRSSNHSTSSSSSSGSSSVASGASAQNPAVVARKESSSELEIREQETRLEIHPSSGKGKPIRSDLSQSVETHTKMKSGATSVAVNDQSDSQTMNGDSASKTGHTGGAKQTNDSSNVTKIKQKKKAVLSKKRALEESQSAVQNQASDAQVQNAQKKQKIGSSDQSASQPQENKDTSSLNKSKKRKPSEIEIKPFNYETADFKMFGTKKKKQRGAKKGKGGRGGKSGQKASRGAFGGRS